MADNKTDLHKVPERQGDIHLALLNWAAWVKPRPAYQQHPMWRKSMSNAFQWHAPIIRDQIDPNSAQAMEKRIGKMPRRQADALRWWYVYQTPPHKARQYFGETLDGLAQLVIDARDMCRNTV